MVDKIKSQEKVIAILRKEKKSIFPWRNKKIIKNK